MEQSNNTSTGLAVKILSVIGGLIATICLIAFLALADIGRSNTILSVTALVFIVGAIVANRVINSLFLDTSVIALYVTGCIALWYAMGNSGWSMYQAIGVEMLIAVLTLLLSKGSFFPFLAVLLFNASLCWLAIPEGKDFSPNLFLVLLIVMGAIFVLLNLYEARIITAHPVAKQLFRPLHAGYFVTFTCGLIALSAISDWFDYSTGVLSAFVWVGIVLMLRQAMQAMRVKDEVTRILVYIACFLFLLPTLFAPALSGALLLLLICFCYGYKTEMGASLLLFIYAIVKYYYDLQLTLLTKSIILFLTGVLLLSVWYFFTKYTHRHHEEI